MQSWFFCKLDYLQGLHNIQWSFSFMLLYFIHEYWALQLSSCQAVLVKRPVHKTHLTPTVLCQYLALSPSPPSVPLGSTIVAPCASHKAEIPAGALTRQRRGQKQLRDTPGRTPNPPPQVSG